MEIDPRVRRADQEAAKVIVELLKIEEPVESVMEDLVEIDRSDLHLTYAFEVGSSVGDLAFLIYIYDYVGSHAAMARLAYSDAFETLEAAARYDTPGPRMVSAYETSAAGVILATTPAAYDRLEQTAAARAGTPLPPAPPARVWKSEAERVKERREQAERLLRALKAADRAAARWSEAVKDGDTQLPAEVELRLFLTDERSIGALIRLMDFYLNPNASEQIR